MKLEGMHHITMITGDAQQNVTFYADVLGLRLVKKTVNFDAPEAYHLYFGDEQGSPGSILTWFEFAGAPKGRSGPGMIHTIQLGVGAEAALDFWEERLGARGVETWRADRSLRFTDYDGLGLELVVADDGNPPLRAEHPEVPTEHAITGVEGVRAYLGRGKHADRQLLTNVLGFEEVGDPHVGEVEYILRGDERHFHWGYDIPRERGLQGAGTVHHIAWHSLDDDHVAWQQRVGDAGMHVTPVIDRDYFNAIYFRQQQGILFEIATTSPGFAVDEDAAHLGEGLRLPTQHEHLRPQLERVLTPLVNPRQGRAGLDPAPTTPAAAPSAPAADDEARA
ncbi:MAG: VOC family protein [Patulibacter minatonensis]